MEKKITSNISTLRPPPSAISHNKTLIGVLLLAFLGFLDASYLTLLGFMRVIPPCNATHGCETVLTSKFAYIGNVPLAALGIGYFVIVMVLTLMLLQNYKKQTLQLLMTVVTAAFMAGIGLIGIQAFILHAFCQYCLAAEAIMTIVFGLVGWIYFREVKTSSKRA